MKISALAELLARLSEKQKQEKLEAIDQLINRPVSSESRHAYRGVLEDEP